MLKTTTKEQEKRVEEILEPISYWLPDKGVGVHIDDYVTYDKLAELVDYLRSIKPKKGSIDMSIVSSEMREVVETWLAYKKEKGQSYKPTGFRTFYKKLCEMSSNDPQIAMLIIEQSMQNNYAGIFPLRNNNNNSNNYGRVKTNSDRFIESAKAANEFSQMLRENIGKQTELGDGDSSAVW